MPRRDRSFREDDVFRFWTRNLSRGEIAEALVLFGVQIPRFAERSAALTGLSLERTIGNQIVLRYGGPLAVALTELLTLSYTDIVDNDQVLEGLGPLFDGTVTRTLARVGDSNPFLPVGLRRR